MACYDSPWCIIHVCPNLGGVSIASLSYFPGYWVILFSPGWHFSCHQNHFPPWREDCAISWRPCLPYRWPQWNRALEPDAVRYLCSAALVLSNMHSPLFLWGTSGGTLLCIVLWLCKWYPSGICVCIRLSVLTCADGFVSVRWLSDKVAVIPRIPFLSTTKDQ